MLNDSEVDSDPWVVFLLKEGADADKEPHTENSMESPLLPVVDEEGLLKPKSFQMFKAHNYRFTASKIANEAS